MIVTTNMQWIFIFQIPALMPSVLWYSNGFVDAVGRPDFFSQMVFGHINSFKIKIIVAI